MIKAILKPTVALFGVTLVAAAIVGFAIIITEEPILHAREQAELAAIASLLPDAYNLVFVDLSDHSSTLTRLTVTHDVLGDFSGYVLSASPSGYSGAVNLMVAFSREGYIKGLRIVSHTETPGLGNHIEAAWFTTQFEGRRGELTASRNPANPQEVDTIVSATISVNAVLRGVNDAIRYFEEELGD